MFPFPSDEPTGLYHKNVLTHLYGNIFNKKDENTCIVTGGYCEFVQGNISLHSGYRISHLSSCANSLLDGCAERWGNLAG